MTRTYYIPSEVRAVLETSSSLAWQQAKGGGDKLF